jgi:hypothetical protein
VAHLSGVAARAAGNTAAQTVVLGSAACATATAGDDEPGPVRGDVARAAAAAAGGGNRRLGACATPVGAAAAAAAVIPVPSHAADIDRERGSC